MNLKNIAIGKHFPDKVNFIIEIPKGESQVKYEFDSALGILRVDRFLTAPMLYPCNYGYIPATMASDGDALDGLLLSPCAIMPSALIEARPVAVMKMQDESGIDDKIILAPDDSMFDDIQDLGDITCLERKRIEHFFKHYKELDGEKWSEVNEWGDAKSAKKIIEISAS